MSRNDLNAKLAVFELLLLRKQVEDSTQKLSLMADAAYREYYRRLGMLDRYERYTLKSLSDDGRSLLFEYGGWMDVLPTRILWDMDGVVKDFKDEQERRKAEAAQRAAKRHDFVLIEGC